MCLQKSKMNLSLKVTLVNLLFWIGLTISPPPVNSQLRETKVIFSPPIFEGKLSRTGSPPSRTKSPGRGPCSEIIVALVPGEEIVKVDSEQCQSKSLAFPGLTMLEHPMLWVYVPSSQIPEISGEIALIERDSNRLVHRQAVALSGKAGVVGIPFEKALELDKDYRWSFSLQIHPNRPTKNPTVGGLVRRASLETDLAQFSSPREKIAFLASKGFWYDALSLLAELRQEKPQDAGLLADWQDLLESVGLGAFADAPFASK